MHATVTLRAVRDDDLPDFVRWLSDPEVAQYTIREFEGVTLEGERAWLASKQAPESRARVWAIEVEGRAIGCCEVHLESDAPTAFYGIFIGDKSCWGKGYGTAATAEAVRLGFEEMGLERIWLHVGSHNPRGVRCYEKASFRHEGRLRRAKLKRGAWIDIICMGVLRDEWEAATRGREREQTA